MKQVTALLLALLMLLALSACGQSGTPAPEAEPTVAPTSAPTPEPTPEPTPVTTAAAVLLDRVGAVAKTFKLGEKVEVTGERDGCYVLSDGLLVEKWLVRPEGEAAPAERRAYAAKNAAVYDNPYCEGEPLLTLGYAQSFTVLDEFGLVLRVKVEDKTAGELTGYMPTADSMKSVSYYEGGGGGGGGPQDGGEISLTRAPGGASYGYLTLAAKTITDAPDFTGPALVLADGVEAYYSVFDRGDEVRVLEKGDAQCTLLLEDGNTAAIPTALLSFEGDEAYESWTAYAKNGALFYPSWRVRVVESEKLKMNAVLTILGVFGENAEYYIAELEAGEVGLVTVDKASETENHFSYDGGGGGGGGGPEWSDPVL